MRVMRLWGIAIIIGILLLTFIYAELLGAPGM
jgi:hypothetical protein